MSESGLKQALQKIQQGFDQKVSLKLPHLNLELSVRGEQAIGQIFDHFPLAQLSNFHGTGDIPHFHIKWVDSSDYGFTPAEWREEIHTHFHVNGQELHLAEHYLAIIEARKILLIASYDLAVGFLDFLKWLQARNSAYSSRTPSLG
jgi:hypothetical protein